MDPYESYTTGDVEKCYNIFFFIIFFFCLSIIAHSDFESRLSELTMSKDGRLEIAKFLMQNGVLLDGKDSVRSTANLVYLYENEII